MHDATTIPSPSPLRSNACPACAAARVEYRCRHTSMSAGEVYDALCRAADLLASIAPNSGGQLSRSIEEPATVEAVGQLAGGKVERRTQRSDLSGRGFRSVQATWDRGGIFICITAVELD
jgi:hypothetical protein